MTLLSYAQTNVICTADKRERDCRNVSKRLHRGGHTDCYLLDDGRVVNIRFTSTLTSEDENRIAPAILEALASILDLLPVAYMVRIDTVDSQVYQLTGPGKDAPQSNIRLFTRDPETFES